VSASSSNADYNLLNELNAKFDSIISLNIESKEFMPSFKKPQSLQGEG
jgi:hypothetical protein